MGLVKKRDLWYDDTGINNNCLRALKYKNKNNQNKMESTQLSFKWDKKLLTKIVMTGTGIVLTAWLIVNLALGMTTNWQEKYTANKTEGCIIEREWCKEKLSQPDLYSIEDLKRCAEKVKWTCDFQ